MLKKWPARVAVGLAAVFVLMQLVPYGRDHTNPPARVEPAWPSPAVRALAVRACFDCHSNQTVWPWYSHVAPISWLVQRDTDEGRSKLNFSESNRPQRKADEAADEVREGGMPLWFYKIPHPSAGLSPAESTQLADGLAAMFGGGEGGGEAGEAGEAGEGGDGDRD
jgi:hypothetical protein